MFGTGVRCWGHQDQVRPPPSNGVGGFHPTNPQHKPTTGIGSRMWLTWLEFSQAGPAGGGARLCCWWDYVNLPCDSRSSVLGRTVGCFNRGGALPGDGSRFSLQQLGPTFINAPNFGGGGRRNGAFIRGKQRWCSPLLERVLGVWDYVHPGRKRELFPPVCFCELIMRRLESAEEPSARQ